MVFKSTHETIYINEESLDSNRAEAFILLYCPYNYIQNTFLHRRNQARNGLIQVCRNIICIDITGNNHALLID